MPIVFASLHFSYGLGSVLGLLNVLLSKEFWKVRVERSRKWEVGSKK